MKVVLRSDVDGVGTAGQVIEVADGFARNHLIPLELALPATDGMMKQADEMVRARTNRVEREIAKAKENAKTLKEKGVTIAAQAGETGQLYGSITAAEISEAVQELVGEPVDRRKLEIEAPIKALGSHEIMAQLHAEVQITFTVEVIATQ